MKVYQDMLEIAYKLNLPKYFRTDLTKHDKHFLETKNPSRFVWIIYRSGTHIFDLSDPITILELSITHNTIKDIFVKSNLFTDNRNVYWIENGHIEDMSIEEVLDSINDLIYELESIAKRD
jgi:hypothetical protein